MAAWRYEFYLLVLYLKFASLRGRVISSIYLTASKRFSHSRY